jgi:hypothetical protein
MSSNCSMIVAGGAAVRCALEWEFCRAVGSEDAAGRMARTGRGCQRRERGAWRWHRRRRRRRGRPGWLRVEVSSEGILRIMAITELETVSASTPVPRKPWQTAPITIKETWGMRRSEQGLSQVNRFRGSLLVSRACLRCGCRIPTMWERYRPYTLTSRKVCTTPWSSARQAFDARAKIWGVRGVLA